MRRVTIRCDPVLIPAGVQTALDVVGAIEDVEFAMSADYGVVTSCPTNLGTGPPQSLLGPSARSDGHLEGTDNITRLVYDLQTSESDGFVASFL